MMTPSSLFHHTPDITYQVRTKTINQDGRSFLTIPEEEVDRLKRELVEERLRKAIIAVAAKQRNISEASARRWVQRKEKQGYTIKDLIEQSGLKQKELTDEVREVVERERGKTRRRGRTKRQLLGT
jgi:Asp-tRNA(Asn)/Glu-tRNA(Gln) amidotransferase B subunit